MFRCSAPPPPGQPCSCCSTPISASLFFTECRYQACVSHISGTSRHIQVYPSPTRRQPCSCSTPISASFFPSLLISILRVPHIRWIQVFRCELQQYSCSLWQCFFSGKFQNTDIQAHSGRFRFHGIFYRSTRSTIHLTVSATVSVSTQPSSIRFQLYISWLGFNLFHKSPQLSPALDVFAMSTCTEEGNIKTKISISKHMENTLLYKHPLRELCTFLVISQFHFHQLSPQNFLENLL